MEIEGFCEDCGNDSNDIQLYDDTYQDDDGSWQKGYYYGYKLCPSCREKHDRQTQEVYMESAKIRKGLAMRREL